MSQLRQISPRDLEGLSAYVDGRLPPVEAAALQRRLERDSQLRGALEDLRRTVSLLHSLPKVPVPRSFALTPDMIGRPAVRWYPVLQLGTALAGLAFVVVVGFDALAQNQRSLAARVLSGEAEAPAAESETGGVSLFGAEAATGTPLGTTAPAADMLTLQATPEALAPMAAAPTSCPSCPREAAGTAAAGAQKAYPTPTSVPLAPEEGPVVDESRPVQPGISAVRAVEILLALLALAFAGLALRLRRRGPV